MASAVSVSAAGPHGTARKQYSVTGMDSTSNKVDVWYPKDAGSYPFISYSHGNTAGGSKTVGDYDVLLSTMASYGYIIAAHESCDTGCAQGGTDILNPPGFKDMYKEQLKVIDWAKQQSDDVFSNVNFEIGVGISGHSMGGQATMKASGSLGMGHGIKAAVMHHAYSINVYNAPLVPFAAFTGSADVIATPGQTTAFYSKAADSLPRAYINKAGASHLEPNFGSADLGVYTAAWFKNFLDETPQADGNDYFEMIFGNGPTSLCNGGDGDMTACEVHNGQSPAPPTPAPPQPTPAPTPPQPTPAPVPTPSGFTCDQCEAQGYSKDACNCGVCGSFGACSFSCTVGGGRVACEQQISV